MIAKILCISDMHKRYRDPSSIKGLIKVQEEIQNEIIDYVQHNGITHIIILGDWYDRGFHGLGQAYGAMEMDRRISAAVNGNVYLCVGNHFYLERDENPEMYIIQPNDLIRTQMDIPLPDRPIFRVVETLRFGPVQIDFFHFRKTNKNYVSNIRSDVKYHIGIYHDEVVVPGWVREQEGFSGRSTQAFIDTVYGNIDLAIHGHIHTKIGACDMQLTTGRKVPMFIPGAMCATANRDSFKHAETDLPVITIDDNYSVGVGYASFSTHVGELRFYNKNKKKVAPILNERSTGDIEISTGTKVLQSLPVYLRAKGYGEDQLKFVDAAAANHLDFTEIVRLLTEDTTYGS